MVGNYNSDARFSVAVDLGLSRDDICETAAKEVVDDESRLPAFLDPFVDGGGTILRRRSAIDIVLG